MKYWVLAIAIAGVLLGCATTTSSTGRKQYVGGVSQEQLNQLGAQAFVQAKSKGPLSTDAKQNAYVRCIVNALVLQLPPADRSTAWETAVFTNKEPNAFALPGGKVGVNTGIFTVAKNQDQLAAVLAHEIGHVVEHHHDERITRQMNTQMGLGVIGALAGAKYGQTGSDAVSQFGGLGAQGFILLPGSRTQETEADVVGQRLMAGAGFNPEQAVNLWENMMTASGGRQPEWLSTHPDPRSRIQELRSRATSLLPAYEQARKSGYTPKCG